MTDDQTRDPPGKISDDDCCFLTDAEIIRKLKLPEKVGRRALRDLEKSAPSRPKFPSKDPLFGDRRFWPAVEKYLKVRYGVERNAPASSTPQWQENFDAPRKPPTKAE